jgi:hypothetical protein
LLPCAHGCSASRCCSAKSISCIVAWFICRVANCESSQRWGNSTRSPARGKVSCAQQHTLELRQRCALRTRGAPFLALSHRNNPEHYFVHLMSHFLFRWPFHHKLRPLHIPSGEIKQIRRSGRWLRLWPELHSPDERNTLVNEAIRWCKEEPECTAITLGVDYYGCVPFSLFLCFSTRGEEGGGLDLTSRTANGKLRGRLAFAQILANMFACGPWLRAGHYGVQVTHFNVHTSRISGMTQWNVRPGRFNPSLGRPRHALLRHFSH